MSKYFFIMISVFLGISGTLFAQDNLNKIASGKSRQPFYIPSEAIKNNFYLELDKGNSLKVALSDVDDFQKVLNLDSVINNFKDDFDSLADSFSNPLSIKSIDYLTDEVGRTFIRCRQFDPKSKNYILSEGHRSPIKIKQDTVRIVRLIKQQKNTTKVATSPKRYIVITFYLNDYRQLYKYATDNVDSALTKIYVAAKKKTSKPKYDHRKLIGNYSIAAEHAHKEPSILSPLDKGKHNYLTLLLEGNLQNVYQYIAPSLTLGGVFGFYTNGINHQIILGWEPMFLFEKNKKDVLQTYRNGWLKLGYRFFSEGENKSIFTQAGFSLSYLMHKEGEFFDKNTFRISVGGVGIKNNRILLQPVIYFHDFFRGITPGLRLSVSL